MKEIARPRIRLDQFKQLLRKLGRRRRGTSKVLVSSNLCVHALGTRTRAFCRICFRKSDHTRLGECEKCVYARVYVRERERGRPTEYSFVAEWRTLARNTKSISDDGVTRVQGVSKVIVTARRLLILHRWSFHIGNERGIPSEGPPPRCCFLARLCASPNYRVIEKGGAIDREQSHSLRFVFQVGPQDQQIGHSDIYPSDYTNNIEYGRLIFREREREMHVRSIFMGNGVPGQPSAPVIPHFYCSFCRLTHGSFHVGSWRLGSIPHSNGCKCRRHLYVCAGSAKSIYGSSLEDCR